MSKLYDLAKSGDYEGAKQLLEQGGGDSAVPGQPLLKQAFSEAASQGHDDIALLLIEKGFDVVKCEFKITTPMILAATGNCPKLLNALIAMNMEIDTAGVSSWNPLSSAAGLGHIDICRTLIAHRANVNYRRHDGDTPLHGAASNDHQDVCQLLVESGAYVDEPNHMGKTALMAAAKAGHAKTCRTLLNLGAQVNTIQKSGKTALEFAIENNKSVIVDLLLQHGADPNAGAQGRSLLARAVDSIDLSMVQSLLRYGAEHKGLNDPQIDSCLQIMQADAARHFKTHPTRAMLFDNEGLCNLTLEACATDQFLPLIADPLLNSKNPADHKLLNDLCHHLPPYWKNQYSCLAAIAASQCSAPASYLSKEGKTHG